MCSCRTRGPFVGSEVKLGWYSKSNFWNNDLAELCTWKIRWLSQIQSVNCKKVSSEKTDLPIVGKVENLQITVVKWIWSNFRKVFSKTTQN